MVLRVEKYWVLLVKVLIIVWVVLVTILSIKLDSRMRSCTRKKKRKREIYHQVDKNNLSMMLKSPIQVLSLREK
jgi:hypothetical protein